MRPAHLGTAVLAAVLSLTLAPSLAGAGTGDRSGVGSVRVSFPVRNVNGSLLPCAADGSDLRLSGRLIGPQDLLHRRRLGHVTVYVHDFATGPWFWRFPAEDLNHARQMARLGQVSLVLRRAGYGAARSSDGNGTCLGAQADMLHQVVQQLRSGDYDSAARHSPPARRVVTAGHSVGAGIVQLEAASFDDVDGIALMSWSDAGPSQRAVDEAMTQTQVCAGGGDDRVEESSYAFFGQTRADLRELLFHSAPADVQREAARRRNPDPCGDVLTLGPLLSLGNVSSRAVRVPVLLLFGGRDVLSRPDAATTQQRAYSPGVPVTTHVLAGTGSALPLERTAQRTRGLMARWTCRTFGC